MFRQFVKRFESTPIITNQERRQHKEMARKDEDLKSGKGKQWWREEEA